MNVNIHGAQVWKMHRIACLCGHSWSWVTMKRFPPALRKLSEAPPLLVGDDMVYAFLICVRGAWLLSSLPNGEHCMARAPKITWFNWPLPCKLGMQLQCHLEVLEARGAILEVVNV